MTTTDENEARERAVSKGSLQDSDTKDLIAALTGRRPRGEQDLKRLAWASVQELVNEQGLTESQAARLAAAFELGRRAAWAPPARGQRCLDPAIVHELMRYAAHEDKESFFVIMLDVRGRLMRTERVATGSLSQCPVSPRDALRPAIREGAHSLIFVHNHPSGDPTPSPEDFDLTERLRAAAEIAGIATRDHVIVASGGYYSFVEAGRWRR